MKKKKINTILKNEFACQTANLEIDWFDVPDSEKLEKINTENDPK